MAQVEPLLQRFAGCEPEEILLALARDRGEDLQIETSSDLIGTAAALCLRDSTVEPPVNRVYCAPDLSPGSREFVLLHEAAHLAFDDLSTGEPGLLRLRHQCGDPEKEVRCELFALLLPSGVQPPEFYRLARSLSGGLPR